MNAFAYMLDTAAQINAPFFKEIKHVICIFDFIWQLGMFLVNAYITRRLANPVGLQQTVITKIRQVLKLAESPKEADVSMQDASDKNRCHIFIE